MAIHTTKFCPYCHEEYERYSHYPGNSKQSYGSPFINCKYCGKTFVDTDFKEAALEPYDKNAFSILKCLMGTFFTWGLGALFFTTLVLLCKRTFELYYICLGFTIIVDLIYVSITIYFICNRKKFQHEYFLEYEASKKRLSNTNYANAIQKLGFDVPAHFFHDTRS